jgi:alpha-D-xyloside xylohydrolase
VPLEVRHYGTAPGAFMLFDDDGETCAYQRGEYRWWKLEVQASPAGELQGSISDVEGDWLSAYGEITWRFFR